MARTIAERELTPSGVLAARFARATEADDGAIRRLLRENPMPGPVSLTFEREPSYFRGANVAGGDDQSIIAWSGERLVCMGRCSRRTCWLNGNKVSVAYLAELRLDAATRGRFGIVRDGYRYFHDMRPDGMHGLYFTSIGADNERARSLLERGARGMPQYSYLSELVTLLIAVPRSPRRSKVGIQIATVDHIPTMLAILNDHARDHQLGAAWTEDILISLHRHGLPLNRFRLITEGGRILACGALWDQRGFRQTVVRGYSPALSFARPLVNLAGRYLNTPRMPLPGHPLAHAFLSPLAFARDAGMLLPEVIDVFLPLAAELGLEYLTLALPAADSRLPILRRRFLTREWHSRLYRVDWPDQPRFEIAACSCLPFSRYRPFMNAVLNPQIPGLLPRASATGRQRDEMFALLSSHFEGVTREQFERDLAEKNWVVEIRREGRLLGFSTLLVTDAEFDGTAITAIYSGDTIVTPEAWGSPALARTWIHSVNSLRADFSNRPCYWLLLTSGFRTYRFLPVFWREFFPCFEIETPRSSKRLLDHLAGAQYGYLYDPATGLVRFPHPQKLRGAVGAVLSGRTNDPHIAFFLSQNPGHAAGHELACLTEISERNLSRAGRRMVANMPR